MDLSSIDAGHRNIQTNQKINPLVFKAFLYYAVTFKMYPRIVQ